MLKLAAVLFGGLVVGGVGLAQDDVPEVDREKAMRVLQSIGADVEGASEGCTGCHDPNMIKISKWADQAFKVGYLCLTDSEELPEGFETDARYVGDSPEGQINCMRQDPTDPNSPFDVHKLGFLTAGAHLDYFRNKFIAAYGEDEGPDRHEDFVEQVGMPKNDTKLTAEQFGELKEWYSSWDPRYPFLIELVGEPGETPRTCTPWRSDSLDDYLAELDADNWSERNLANGISMFGCPRDSFDPMTCFTDSFDLGDVYPALEESNWGTSWPSAFDGQKMRVLYELPFQTSFWMRSSADGRFVANGLDKPMQGGFSSDDESEDAEIEDESSEEDVQELHGMITDLVASKRSGSLRTNIGVAASYDPTFFPDNSGFLFQGQGNGFCQQSILLDPNLYQIDFSQPGCSVSNEINLYQSVGASLDGTDYFSVTGIFTGDSDTSSVSQPEWLTNSFLDVNPIAFDGDVYEALPSTRLWTPYLGDFGLSPSTNLTIARVAGLNDEDGFIQLGYDISRLRMGRDADDLLTIEMEPMARVCHAGGKANFSFDERFVVTHVSVTSEDFAEFGFSSADDADFQQLVGSNNIHLFDLATGETFRLTTVGPNQHAKFPHFRSDGWIYFLALSDDHSYVVATDAALRVARLN